MIPMEKRPPRYPASSPGFAGGRTRRLVSICSPPIFFVACLVFNITAYGADTTATTIGSRLEMFVDDSLIERMKGLELRMHHPVKAPRPASPLPEKHYITVIKDNDRYRAYWRGNDPDYQGPPISGSKGETVCYAESRDGHDWTFPELGLHEISGSKKNNVILARQPQFLHNFVPFLDNRPGVDPKERYKALAGHPGPGDKRGLKEKDRGLFAFLSADGIHWRRTGEVIPYRPEWRHAFDSANVSFWSAAERKYICYFRTWTSPERLRSVSRTTSADFKTWTRPVAMNPNLPGEHLYTTQTHPYFRTPHIYIALPTRYVPGRGEVVADPSKFNATDILLMSTRAGSKHYDRLFTEAFIRPGLNPERWRNRANYVALNVIPTGDHEMSIYHRSGDRYVLRTDGFVSINAGSQAGELVTKPIVFTGDELWLNLSASAVGEARVEVQAEDGTPLSGFRLADCVPVHGDAIALKVNWKQDADLHQLSGKPIRLRFVLKECDLFSYRFAPSAP